MFEVGKQYRNRKGGYVVLALSGGSMRVRFESGVVQDLAVSAQERIWGNIQREEQTQQEQDSVRGGRRNLYDPVVISRGGAYYQMLGFFLSCGHQLEVFVTDKSEPYLRGDYFSDTGQELPEKGVYFHQQKWGRESRIKCAMSEHDIGFLRNLASLCSSYKFDIEVLSDGTINCNELMRSLWQNGFRLGVVTQSVNAVRATIPPEHLASFEEGLSYGLRA